MDGQTLPRAMFKSPHGSTQVSPRHNRLLGGLPEVDYLRLFPDLEFVQLPLGWTVYDVGEAQRYGYFPTSGIVSMLNLSQNGFSGKTAEVGNEGIVGIALFMGGQSQSNRAVVESAGFAYRIRAQALLRNYNTASPLRFLLLRYVQALMTHTAQTVVCNRFHSIEQQLCRWLLMCLDRLSSNELAVTQELIASMLGVRREGVTQAAGRLQAAGLIHYSRGKITVLDRPGLEAQVCECYTVVKREYARLLPETVATQDRLRPH